MVMEDITYENSSLSVHWMTLSRTKTIPWSLLSKTRTSWYLDFSWCRTWLTFKVMAWPGHWSDISRNQPSAIIPWVSCVLPASILYTVRRTFNGWMRDFGHRLRTVGCFVARKCDGRSRTARAKGPRLGL